MRLFFGFFLATVLVLNVSVNNIHGGQYARTNPVTVEDNYSLSDTYRVVQGESSYEKLNIYGKERYKQAVQSTKKAMKLPIVLGVDKIENGFLMPSDINGIIMDIPYNYYSSINSSSRYFYTLLKNGWEIEYYNSSSLCVQIGLVNDDGITGRLLIFEDFLKVYCRLM